MRLANQVLDFNDDVSKDLFKTIPVKEAPELVKQAEVSGSADLLKAGNAAYALSVKEADVVVNKFPIHTAADAWLSAQYFEKTASKLPEALRKEVGAKIASALKAHSISPITKSASETPKQFALKDRYPIDSAPQVKQACAYFEDWKHEFTPSELREYATKVANQANTFGLPVPASLKKYAGEGYGTEVGVQLRKRQDLVTQASDLLTSLQKVAMAKDTLAPEKFAELLSAWDKEAGVEKYHGKYLADPYAATYEEKEFRKVASGYRWEDESTGLKMNEADLKKVAEESGDKIKSYLGASVTKELQKHGYAIFDSLPIDAKIVVAKIAKGMI